MSKKSRQSRAAPQPAGAPPASSPAGPRPSRDSGFNPDYSYVRHDLRRIGLLAGTFIVLMIAASFLLR